jgi:chromosome segregation ATPase
MDEQRKADANTIASLREQISATGSSTLSKLHEAAVRMEGAGARQSSSQRQANAELVLHDRNVKNSVTQALDKKDRLIKKLETEKVTLAEARAEAYKKIGEKDQKI